MKAGLLAAYRTLREAALDQPHPTRDLKRALSQVLTLEQHPLRDRKRDPRKKRRRH